MKHFPNKIARL